MYIEKKMQPSDIRSCSTMDIPLYTSVVSFMACEPTASCAVALRQCRDLHVRNSASREAEDPCFTDHFGTLWIVPPWWRYLTTITRSRRNGLTVMTCMPFSDQYQAIVSAFNPLLSFLIGYYYTIINDFQASMVINQQPIINHLIQHSFMSNEL